MAEETGGLSTAEISSFVTSPVKEVRRIIEDSDYSQEDLDRLLEAEENGKDRKTVKQALKEEKRNVRIEEELELAEKEVNQLQKILDTVEDEENISSGGGECREVTEDEVIQLVGGTIDEMEEFLEENRISIEGLDKLVEAERKVKDRKNAVELLEEEKDRRKIEEDTEDAEKDLEELMEDLERLNEDEEDRERPFLDEEGGEDSGEVTGEGSGSEEDEVKEENSEEDEGAEESDEEGGAEQDDLDSEEEGGGLEEKRSIVEDLDVDFSDEKLRSVSMEDLKELKQDKERREKLVQRLMDEGLDEGRLRSASTSDLEKLASQLDDGEKDEDDEEKSEEEIREEAEEDLQMLMGAGMNDGEEEEDERRDPRDRIEELKSSFRETMSRDDEEEEEGDGFDPEDIVEKLDSYQSLDKDREAAVKTAHILKAFLEYRLKFEREMTYGELAENLPEDAHSEMDEVAEFFRQMQENEYTESFSVEGLDGFIESSKDVVKGLEG